MTSTWIDKSAHASETVMSVVTDWGMWGMAIAPAAIVISSMTERGGAEGLILSVSMIVAVACLIMDQRRNFQFQLREVKAAQDGLAAKTIEANRAVAELKQELDLAHTILEGNAPPAKRGRITKRLRQQVYKRCMNTCWFCARRGTTDKDPDGETWHIEHVVPVNRGGPTRADNLTLACSSCNLRKGTMPAYAFIQKLIKEGVYR